MKKLLVAFALLFVLVSAVHAQGRYPQTAQRILSASEVSAMSCAKSRYALNEIYARHGYVFRSKAITSEFRRYSWYRPVKGRTMAQVEARLNYYEKRNIEILSQRKQAYVSDNSNTNRTTISQPKPSETSQNGNLDWAMLRNRKIIQKWGYRGVWTNGYAKLEIKPNGELSYRSQYSRDVRSHSETGIFWMEGKILKHKFIYRVHWGTHNSDEDYTIVETYTPHNNGSKMEYQASSWGHTEILTREYID